MDTLAAEIIGSIAHFNAWKIHVTLANVTGL